MDTVSEQRNGYDGLEALKIQRYKAAFIDRNMPVMDGLECIRRYRKWESLNDKKHRKMKQFIVMFSANAHEDDIKDSLSTGADKFLPKPITIQTLLDCVHGAEQLEVESRKRSSRGIAAVHAAEIARSPRLRQASGNTNPKKPPRRLQPINDLASSVESMQEMVSEAKNINQKEILVVDDDVSTRKLMKRMLEKHRFLVETCSNGKQALELLKEHSGFYAALIDMNMPVMGGKQCVSEYRQWEQDQMSKGLRKHQVGIIVVSGSDREETFTVKADMVLSKPVQVEELIRAINSLSKNVHSDQKSTEQK